MLALVIVVLVIVGILSPSGNNDKKATAATTTTRTTTQSTKTGQTTPAKPAATRVAVRVVPSVPTYVCVDRGAGTAGGLRGHDLLRQELARPRTSA